MSGIGEAASIAGLITISGQCVKQISNLYSFARDFHNVLPQTKSLLNELEGIQQCLSQVESVASKALAANSCDASTSVDALFRTVDQCQGAITAMEGQLKAVYTGKKRIVLKRLRITAAKDFFARFKAQIAAQKQDLLLQLETLSCDLDLQTHNSMERLTASSSTMETKVNDMTQSLDRHHDLSERNLQCIDARLEAMQKMLPRSISTNQRSNPKSRKTLASRAKDTKSRCSNPTFQRAEALKSSETQTSVLRPATQPLRVVCPALLIYEKDGLLRRELVPLVCSELNGIEDATKIQVIKYLQGLRLLIWLLKKNNPWTTNVSELGITSRSLFAMQAEWSLSQGFANDYLGSHETFMRAIKFQMLEAVVLLFEVMSPYRQVPPSVIRAAACRKQFKIQEVRILFQETSPQGPVGRWFLELLRTELLYNPTSSVLLGLVDAILRATREPVVGSKCLSRSFI